MALVGHRDIVRLGYGVLIDTFTHGDDFCSYFCFVGFGEGGKRLRMYTDIVRLSVKCQQNLTDRIPPTSVLYFVRYALVS